MPAHPEALTLWRDLRDPACVACPIGAEYDPRNHCLLGNGPVESARAMVVTTAPDEVDDRLKHPLHGRGLQLFERVAREDLGVDLTEVYTTYAVKCRPPLIQDKAKAEKVMRAAQAACDHFLLKEIARVRPETVFAMGPEAYYFFKHAKGLFKHRGEAFEWTHPDDPSLTMWVVPSLDPDDVIRAPKYFDGFAADVAKWARLMRGETADELAIDVVEVRSLAGFHTMMIDLLSEPDRVMTFDLETRGFQSARRDYSRLWLGAVTNGTRTPRGMRVYLVGIEHPDAPWYDRAGEDLHGEVRRRVVEGWSDLILRYDRGVNGHNVKFDLRWTRATAKRYGFGAPGGRVAFDTMVAAHLIDEQQSMTLLSQGSTHLGVNNWGKGNQFFGTREGEPHDILARNAEERSLKSTGRRKKATAAADHSDLGDLWGEEGLGYYCAKDTAYTHMLYEQQRDTLRSDPPAARLAKNLSLPGTQAFAAVEDNGIWVDWARVERTTAEALARIDQLQTELMHHVGKDMRSAADFGSDSFLRRWIYGSMEDGGLALLPRDFTPTGMPKVDEATLAALEHPALTILKEVKSLSKMLDYFEQWRVWVGDDGRLHPYFNMTGADTGRRSCQNPPLQQIPRPVKGRPNVRSCLGAPPGRIFLEVDFSQLEVRLSAWMAGEETMLSIFARGGDIYRATAALVLGKPEEEVTGEERQKAKAYVLGFIYGMGAAGFVRYAKKTYGLDFSLEEARRWRDLFFATYPGLVRWHERMRKLAARDHKVTSVAGRSRHLSNILSPNDYERSEAERQAINSPIQGLGADWTLASIVELLTLLPSTELIVGDIHDAVLFELTEETWKESAAIIFRVMESPTIMAALGVDPPVKLLAEGKVGRAWGEGVEFTWTGTEKLPSLETVALAA